MSAYPYDWKGTAATNHFTEERILESDDPSARVLILQHRPFFQNGFTVKQPSATNPLTQGVDYELAYQLTELDDSVEGPVFCGVNIINPQITGPLEFAGNLLGGTFYDGLMEILDELVKYLNNPTEMSFYNVENRPSLYPQTPAATSWADLLNKKYVASAIHDVELDAGAANDDIKAKLAQLRATMVSLAAEVEAFNYPAHIAAKNPHNTTAAQIEAHPISLKAADAFLAYGKTLRQLTTEIRAVGLQQSDIDKYINKYVSNPVQGTYVQMVQANQPLFKSKSGASSIVFSDTGFDLTTTGGIAMRAGYKGAVAYFEWVAGGNTLRIESSGSVLGMDKLTVNGRQLLTTTELMKYQETGDGDGGTDPDDSTLYVNAASPQLSVTGKGSKANPVTLNLTLPDATTTVDGVVALTDSPSATEVGEAVRPQAVAANDAKLATFVPKATRLNSQPMDGTSRTLTKSDLGLGSADNTADVDKPISTELQTALDGKAAKGHKHAWSSLNIPAATSEDFGTVRIAINEANLAAGRGTAPNVLYQLSLTLAGIADKLKDADPKAVTDYAVIGASTWTVASSKLSVSVQDLKYFFMADGSRKEGKATGSVNLETTPMFNWFSPLNQIERNWAPGVLHTTQLALTSAVTTLPLYGRTIGLTDSQMGDLSVISVLAKERVACSSGRLRVMAVAGGNISVYIDGGLVASGSAKVDGAFDVDPSLSTHCVAIRADCNDSSKPAALAFEVWDNNYPIRASSPTTKLVQLTEFIKPQNNRHFLYLNMNTGSLFGRAEPIASDDINVTQCLVGVVDCDATGAVGTTLSFDTVADFGQFAELTAHQNTVPAHVPTSSDWYLSDNPVMKRMAMLTGTPDCIAAGPSSGNVARGQATLSAVAPANTSKLLMLWMDSTYSGPQQWMTPANPNENNLLTYEGSLILTLPTEQTLGLSGTDLWLTFAQSARNGQHKFFSVNPFTDGAEYGYTPEKAINPSALAASGGTITTALAVYPYDITTATLSDSTSWGDDVDGYNNSRYIVRYRFVPKSNTLRVQLVYFEANVGASVRNVTYELPFDLRDCLGQFVGITRKEQTIAQLHQLQAGLIPFTAETGDYKKYHYYRSLFEAYVKGNDFNNQSSVRGVQQYLLEGGALVNWNKLARGTEFVGIPSNGGKPLQSVNPRTALSSYLTPPQGQRCGPEIGRSKLWKSTAFPNGGFVMNRRFALVVELPVDVDKVDGNVTSNYNFQMNLGTGNIVTVNTANGSNVTIPVVGKAISGKAGDLLFIEFTPPSTNVSFYLDATLTLYSNNATVGTVDFNDAATEVVMEDTSMMWYLVKSTPLNITTAVWDWAVTQMKAEGGASPTLGVWN